MPSRGSVPNRKKMQKKHYFSDSDQDSDRPRSHSEHKSGEKESHSSVKHKSDSSATSKHNHRHSHGNSNRHRKRNIFRVAYEDHYKKLMLIPLLIFIVSLGIVGYMIATTGYPMNAGVSITGGISMTIDDVGDFDPVEVEMMIE